MRTKARPYLKEENSVGGPSSLPESWRIIPNSGGRYFVSTSGRFLRVDRNGYLQENKVAKCSNGYCIVSILNKSYRVCRLVAAAFCKTYPGRDQVNHKNGVKDDDRAENLEWVSASENIRHAFRTGLALSGENHSWAKLSNEDVKKIRASTDRNRKLASEYSIHITVIQRIKKGTGRAYG